MREFFCCISWSLAQQGAHLSKVILRIWAMGNWHWFAHGIILISALKLVPLPLDYRQVVIMGHVKEMFHKMTILSWFTLTVIPWCHSKPVWLSSVRHKTRYFWNGCCCFCFCLCSYNGSQLSQITTFFKIYFCVLQKKERHTGLEQHQGE